MKNHWLLVVIGLAGVLLALALKFQMGGGYLASLFLPDSITPRDIKERYANKKVKVLIVPGHDRESGGAEFQNIREADLNIVVAEHLYHFFKNNGHFQVFLAQDKNGYLPEFSDYFLNQKTAIDRFRKNMKEFTRMATDYGFEKRSAVSHTAVNESVASRLYGINKWANDNSIDIVIHIHFNDYAGRPNGRAGRYSGFSIYVPERQLPNADASRELAQSVFKQLIRVLAVSDLPQESAGITEDSELIAVGANVSLRAAALFVEYGYIYEPQFRDEAVLKYLLPELAYQTYAGVAKYFDAAAKLNNYDTTLLPYQWGQVLKFNMKNQEGILALQMALVREGVYPPSGLNLRQCPLTGDFLDCSKSAVVKFQEKYNNDILLPYGFSAGTGIVGPSTISKLNQLYGS